MNELRVHVERAVRPVIATLRTKLRMRNELYSHLLEIHNEELQSTDNEQQAAQSAISRFGEPAELSAELQHTVSSIDYWEGRLDQWIWRRESETVLKHATRLATTYAMIIPLVVPMACLVWWSQVALGNSSKEFGDLIYGLSRYGLSTLIFFVIQVFAFTLFGSWLYQQVESSTVPKSPIKTLALLLSSGSFVLATGFVLLLTMVGDVDESISLLVPQWVIFSLGVPISMVVYTLIVRYETNKAAPWTSLQIDV